MPTSAEEFPEIRILLADRHGLFCGAIRGALERNPGFRVVELPGDATDLVAHTACDQPEVVVFTAPSLHRGRLPTASLIRELVPGARVVLVGTDSRSMLVSALEAGASGYLTQACGWSDFIEALRSVSEGQIYVSECLMEAALDYFADRSLSRGRELGLSERAGRRRPGGPPLALVGGETSGGPMLSGVGFHAGVRRLGEPATRLRAPSRARLRAVAASGVRNRTTA